MSDERPLYLVMGKSATGKDHFVDAMCERYGMTKVKSYTTRSPRSPDEDTHIFISEDYYKSICERMVATTQFDGASYGVLPEQLEDADFYIVDPFGAYTLSCSQNESVMERQMRLIYLDEALATRLTRLAHRPSASEVSVFERLEADITKFEARLLNKVWGSPRWNKQYEMSWSIRCWADKVEPYEYDTFEDFMTQHEIAYCTAWS